MDKRIWPLLVSWDLGLVKCRRGWRAGLRAGGENILH
jgi:hypothetical protein